MTHDTFEAFGFAEPLARALKQCGYATPTPVQAKALSPQLEGRDLLALAETGSGKTAAFVLPLLQDFATNSVNPGPREVLSLILAPTRELALQIDQEVANLTRNLHFIRRAVVLGGVSKGPQISALKRGVHVLVSTPGRLLDHVGERHADLRPVRTFVLDEADRMFDMGFIRDIRKIASMLSMKRRTAMFSATMPAEIRTLAHELLNDPYRVDLSPKQIVVDRIDQKVMIVRANEKQSRLHTILKDEACSRVIVFTRTKRGADRVTDRLAMAGIGAVAIHGNKAQNARQRALKDFSMGHVRVLVATDIAARGIDVSDVTHVINFDMPVEPETYVHRIGRTARKGLTGTAISLCDPSERAEIVAIERLMKQPIEVIGDVGGDVLPMPERRHHDDDRPRREGGARNGSDRGGRSRSGARGERQDGHRGKAHAGHRGKGDGEHRARFAHAEGERPERGHSDQRVHGERGRSERADSAPRRAHGAGADRPNRSGEQRHERGEHHSAARPNRGEQHRRREDGHAAGAGAERRNERNEHRAPRPHGDDRGRGGAEQRSHGARPHGAGSHGGKTHGHGGAHASHGGEQGKPRQERDARGAGGGPREGGKRSWDGQRPPKFLDGSAPRRKSRPNAGSAA